MKNDYGTLERVIYLFCNQDISERKYCEKWEVSRRTYYRDKEFVKNRLADFYNIIQKTKYC